MREYNILIVLTDKLRFRLSRSLRRVGWFIHDLHRWVEPYPNRIVRIKTEDGKDGFAVDEWQIDECNRRREQAGW